MNAAAETLATFLSLFTDVADAAIWLADEREIAGNPLWTETAAVVR